MSKKQSASALISEMGFDVPLITYDYNGNIESLQRYGNHADSVNLIIDDLTYIYDDGNQLVKVDDGSGRESGFTDGADQSAEYLYDGNGNIVKDENKGIDSIEYNHLNLPIKVTFSPTKYIEYTYDASGTKVSQKTVDGGDTKVVDYIAGFVYEDNKLQFLQHDEGRVVALRDEEGDIEGIEYQYHLKDHLGNVRATFKGEIQKEKYLATFEPEDQDYESTYFSRYGEVTRINADIFDHTDDGTGDTYSMRLNGTGNEIEGLAKSLAVKPGDWIDAEVYVKYLDPSTTGTPGSPWAQLIQDLGNNASSVVVDGASAGTEPLLFQGLMGYEDDDSDGPQAYLNILVFDEQYNLLYSAYETVTAEAEEDGTDKDHLYISISSVTIEKPGFVYIYLSNESSSPIEVFFDDFKITYKNSPVVQKDDYYPFGLSFNSYTRPSSVGQKYLYNGKELLDDLNLGLYDYGARMYMPDLGRWMSVDPLADAPEQIDKSPYAAFWNSPIRYNDPDGRCPNCITGLIGAGIGALVGGGIEVATQLYNNGSVTNWSAVGGSALQGGITGGAAGFTGGASLVVTAGVAGTANAAGGAANRAIQGQETNIGDVALDATIGGALGAGGKVVGNAVSGAVDDLSNAAKGKLGEALTNVKYGAKG
ncbi:RHS repeat-associated core domain-containing protein [Echinicola marina]|uniref:RHS repeat-associated core domain-containing protein n=1 Tax=Echinicola marina TaxID=2859768 RepID=UPI001CF6F3BD|nr:RHS repeat-associated core domain-containing protein [Echinicola marina]UCS92407.1 RHS repeat-associated core domain-containing protein [Echinicola marina]